MIEKYIGTRKLYVEKNNDYDVEIPEISSIEHVTNVAEWRYNFNATGKIPKLNKDGLEAEAEYFALIDESNIKIVDGRNIEKDGEAICPAKFYPYNNFIKKDGELVDKIYPSKIIKGKDIIGEEFTIESRNPESDNLNVKIVGTYDSYYNMNEMDICYITKADLKKVQLPYFVSVTSVHDDGTVSEETSTYTGLLVIVDNRKNMDSVIKKLDQLGYAAQKTFYVDVQLIKYFYYIPMFILLITLILSFGILYNNIRKRILYRLKEYAIYLSIGYSQKYIMKINLFESIILILMSLIISLIIYHTTYYILIYGLLSEFIYTSVKIQIPYIYIVLILTITIIISIISTDYLLKKKINTNTYKLLSDNEKL